MANDQLIEKTFTRIERQIDFGDTKLSVWINPRMNEDLGWKEEMTPEEDSQFIERAVKICYSFSDETMARVNEYQYRGVLYDKLVTARNEYFEELRKNSKGG